MKDLSIYDMVILLVLFVTGCSDTISSLKFINNATFINRPLSLRLIANAWGDTRFVQEPTLKNYIPVAAESSGFTVVYELSNSPPG